MAAIRLGFFKLNVAAMAPALAFWRDAFGFIVTASFDEADFHEHILALPGQPDGPNLMLVRYTDGRDVTPGPGHGPVGLICSDIAATHAAALAAGAQPLGELFEAAGARLALLESPQGHAIELLELPD